MGRDKLSKTNLILYAAGLLPVVWIALLVAPAFAGGLSNLLKNLSTVFQNPFHIEFCEDSLKTVLIFLFAYVIGIGIYISTARNYRRREEHGSAKWGRAGHVNKKYSDKNKAKNKILTKNTSIGLDGRRHRRNLNVLVCGGSGAGKTRFYAKPNIMQANTSFVVLDPKGEILRDTGNLLKDKGYEIKVLDLINMEKSHCYNPFVYLKDDNDIQKLVTNIFKNTTPKGSQTQDPFWDNAAMMLLLALVFYLHYEAPEEEQNFATLLEFLNASEAREDDEEFKNAVDLLFEELEADDASHFAVRQYKKYKLAAGKTAKSILISCGARLAPFDIKELRDLTEYDEMELDKIGERKTAFFMIMSDTDGTFNFIIAMMQAQMFNLLCECADDKHGGKLPIHVRFLLDEFANIGQIPQFEKLIATIRSREISASIILQSKSQLKAIYKDHADTIEGNCDTTLFLGGKEKTTLKELSEALGKETIDLYNISDTRGNNPTFSTNYQKTGKDLMSQDEIAIMDGGKCIMMLRGVRPFLSDKYDITKHKRYVQLSDHDEKNLFDIEKYLSTDLRLKKDQIVETYDLGTIT